MNAESRWYHRPRLWLDLFALANLAFLAPDLYLAHSVNSFRHRAEWIPFYFSLGAPVLLLIGILVDGGRGRSALWRFLGHLVGGLAVLVGVAGFIWHLESQFFRQMTLDSLVYTAPFVAPLAYTGIGLLLLMNRLVEPESPEWPMWVLLLALGGFVGNFILSLADHAQNGFFHWAEWIPVVSSAFAIGFLLVPFLVPVNRGYLVPCVAVLLVQAAVGLLGFYYHTMANLAGPAPSLWDNFVWGTPALAPLLFPNLVLLTFLGLAVLSRHLPAVTR
ncbi:MAG: hypothetical protein L0Z62_23425 [Gemmataceae bacterium]|nr:hypothetical protein [Gemmataceae bacterium]